MCPYCWELSVEFTFQTLTPLPVMRAAKLLTPDEILVLLLFHISSIHLRLHTVEAEITHHLLSLFIEIVLVTHYHIQMSKYTETGIIQTATSAGRSYMPVFLACPIKAQHLLPCVQFHCSTCSYTLGLPNYTITCFLFTNYIFQMWYKHKQMWQKCSTSGVKRVDIFF